MPCHVGYTGRTKTIVVPKQRTKIEVQQDMADEYGTPHGVINTVGSSFATVEDHCIEATLFGCNDLNAFMQQRFLYVELDGDKELCERNSWIAVEPVEGMEPAEAVATAAQEWLTTNYREYVHSHDTPQDVFIVGMG